MATPSRVALRSSRFIYMQVHTDEGISGVGELHPAAVLAVSVRCLCASEGGFLIVPQTSGIGIELSDEAFPHYPPVPYTRPPVIGPDGALQEY